MDCVRHTRSDIAATPSLTFPVFDCVQREAQGSLAKYRGATRWLTAQLEQMASGQGIEVGAEGAGRGSGEREQQLRSSLEFAVQRAQEVRSGGSTF